MFHNYRTQETCCNPVKPVSITDNSKYIQPLAEVYYSYITNMVNYPGYDNLYTSDSNNVKEPKEPEITKAYRLNQEKEDKHHDKPQSKCNSCKIII